VCHNPTFRRHMDLQDPSRDDRHPLLPLMNGSYSKGPDADLEIVSMLHRDKIGTVISPPVMCRNRPCNCCDEACWGVTILRSSNGACRSVCAPMGVADEIWNRHTAKNIAFERIVGRQSENKRILRIIWSFSGEVLKT